LRNPARSPEFAARQVRLTAFSSAAFDRRHDARCQIARNPELSMRARVILIRT
jgi:hypothetical protein